jgi:hypothetical protein
MQITDYIVELTGLTPTVLFRGLNPLVRIQQDAQGNVTIPVWNVPNVTAPTSAQIAAALAAPEPQANLASELMAAAQAACNGITTQIVPDPTHQNAYVNAAAIVGPSATVPTVNPAASSFAAMAAAFGIAPQAFATLVSNVAAISMSLSSTLATLETAAAAATTAAQLATALTAFETALAALVTQINGSGLTITITAPAAINIAGINA